MPNARDVMICDVITVTEKDTIGDVLQRFVNNRISGVPIVNKENKPVGYISDGDIMKNIGYRNPKVLDMVTFVASWSDDESLEEKLRKLVQFNVMEIATRRVIAVDVDAEIDDIAHILGEKRIKKVPVLENGRLVGIISRGDLVRYVMEKYLKTVR